MMTNSQKLKGKPWFPLTHTSVIYKLSVSVLFSFRTSGFGTACGYRPIWFFSFFFSKWKSHSLLWSLGRKKSDVELDTRRRKPKNNGCSLKSHILSTEAIFQPLEIPRSFLYVQKRTLLSKNHFCSMIRDVNRSATLCVSWVIVCINHRLRRKQLIIIRETFLISNLKKVP